MRDGAEVTMLAMRFDLVNQIRKVTVPGAKSHRSLRSLGVKFRVFSDKAIVTDRLSGGGRLAVLSPELTAELLAAPLDDPQENEASDAVTPVTQQSDIEVENLNA